MLQREYAWGLGVKACAVASEIVTFGVTSGHRPRHSETPTDNNA